MAFPINSKNKSFDLAQLKREQCPVSLVHATKVFPYIGAAVGIMQKYASETAPTGIEANKFVNYAIKYGIPGRVIIINKIIVAASGACNLSVFLWRNLAKYAVGLTDFQNDIEEYEGSLTAAGEYVFDFRDNPLMIFGNNVLELSYWLNSTTGVNCSYTLNGFVVTDDLKLNANKLCCIIADSIGGITTTTGDVRDDIWTFRVINKLRNAGVDIRHINKSVGGSTVLQWSNAIQNGMMDMFDTNLFIINLGTNDSSGSETQLTQTEGVDGSFKTEYKAMIMNLHYKNKNAAFVLNTPTPNVHATYGVTEATTGIYTGIRIIDAIKDEIKDIATELALAGLNIKCADLSDLWDPTNAAYYNAGDMIHPKVLTAHGPMADEIFATIETLSAW